MFYHQTLELYIMLFVEKIHSAMYLVAKAYATWLRNQPMEVNQSQTFFLDTFRLRDLNCNFLRLISEITC